MDPNSPVMTIVLIGLMVVAFYFLMIRPQRKRQQKQQETLNALQPGARVLLGSGVFGTIVKIGEKQAVLELSPGNELTVLKQAIVRVVGPEDEEPTETAAEATPEPAAASTLDLKEAEAAEADAKPEDQTWREYSIPQDDDAAAPADVDKADQDPPVKDAQATDQGTVGSGPGTGNGPGTGGGPGSPKD